MAKTTVIAVPIYANPKNFPVNKFRRLERKLKSYLLTDAGPMLKKDMEATTQNWRGAPVFVVKYSEPYGTRMQIDIYPTGRNTLKWKRVSEGTGPRIISAKPGKVMIFPQNYDPKTTPAGRYGGPGRKYGPIQYRKAVYHSTAPRKFTVKIKEKREKKIVSDVNRIVYKVGGR